MKRRNVDEELRRLERDARRGDPQAAERLRAARIRTTGVVPESHRIGMAMVGVFTPAGAVLCVPCDERSGEARPGLRMEHSSDEASNARCDHCGLPVFVRDDVALLQNLRDELRAVHGIDMEIWQTGGMCASLSAPVAGADIMIGVQRAGNLYILDDDRIVAHDRDQPAEYRWQEFGIPYGTRYGEAPTGMLEWYVGAVDEGGEEIDEVMPTLTITTRTVGEAAHLIARHMRRAGVVRNPSSDERRRAAERSADPVGVLRERLRRGEVTTVQVKAAARLGDERAMALEPNEARFELERDALDAFGREILRAGKVLGDRKGLAAAFAADCAERVLPLFERHYPIRKSIRNAPRLAIESARRWVRERTPAAKAAAAMAADAAMAANGDAARTTARVARPTTVEAATAAAYAAAAAAYAARVANVVGVVDVARQAVAAAYAAGRATDAAARADAELDWQRRRLIAYVLREIPLPGDVSRGAS